MNLPSPIATWLGQSKATISAVVGITVLAFDNLSGDPDSTSLTLIGPLDVPLMSGKGVQ